MKPLTPEDEDWDRLAELGPVLSVMDPRDRSGLKNAFIDLLHKMALGDVIVEKPRRLLDFGCGSGRLFPFLSQRVLQIVGVDRTLALLQLAPTGVANTEHLVCADGEALPFRDDSFDAAVTTWTLQYLQDTSELADAAAHIARCLTPGGRIYVLEQAQVRKDAWQRSANAYVEAFARCGCVCEEQYPVRNGRDLLHYAIRYGLVPRRFFPALARREMAWARRRPRPWVPYRDFLFVFRKASSG